MIWELLEKASQINVSQIKSPTGSLYQKYVYSSLMIKMRINKDLWAILVQFRLGIMLKEGICEVQIFGFMRSKSSNLQVCKIWCVDVEMGLYLSKYNFL